MEILLSDEFKENFSLLDSRIQKQADKQIIIFKNNPFYPSLNTEKLSPKERGLWSFRVDKKYRVVFEFVEESKVLFLSIGPHDWIYRRKF
jgi:mRNA-degrading endonuclease RelE of RelBE toxin-antitoxin system